MSLIKNSKKAKSKNQNLNFTFGLSIIHTDYGL